MTATSHGLTGVAIGVLVQNPLALPLAFASHFLLDAFPHFGLPKRNKLFIAYLLLDATLTFALLVWALIFSNQPLLLAGCLILATSPDVIWAYRWYRELKYKEPFRDYSDPLTKFHARIQWFEKPIGIAVELVWSTLMLIIIFK
jgi:hypothetical protein